MTEHQGPQPNPKPFHVETTIDADPAAVWHALTDPGEVPRWFGWDYDGLTEEIRVIFEQEATADPRTRRIDWGDGSYLEVAEADGRTVVRAVLPGDLTDAKWDDVYDGVEEGWTAFLAQLRFLVETRPAGPRRTLFLTGVAGPDELRRAAGTGTTVLTSRRQLGLVDEHGHLVIAATTGLSIADSGPAEKTSVIVSTYGLDDAAFAAVREGWAARWQPVAKDAALTAAGETLPPGLF